MATNFASLKKTSGNDLDTLTNQLEKLNPQREARRGDDRFWQPTVDKAGNGYAVVRFLPASANEEVPFVRVFSHGFQGPGGWYIESSLSTIGRKDPVGELNQTLWNTGGDEGKEQARKQKRKLQFVSNIYVVKDPGNPENEGKVFLYKYGKKIWDKIEAQMNPEFEDETKVNPFDLWQGADFKLKIRKVAGYRNYDSSEFAKVESLLGGDDEALEALYNKLNSLSELVASDQFKEYDVLKKRLNQVLGLSAPSSRPAAQEDSGDEDIEEQLRSARPAFKKEVAAYSEPELPSTATPEPASSDDDDALSWFQSLADE